MGARNVANCININAIDNNDVKQFKSVPLLEIEVKAIVKLLGKYNGIKTAMKKKLYKMALYKWKTKNKTSFKV